MNILTLHKSDYFKHQWSFLNPPKNSNGEKPKIVGLVGGLGCGKTWVFLRKVFCNHLSNKNRNGQSNGWVVYPTYDLAEELFVDPFRDMLEDKGIDYEYNISKHRFTTAYGKIKIYQLQKPQRIIGAELTYIGFDEFDIESWKNCDIAFKKAIGRMRGGDDCEVFIVTSPEGYHYTYKIFVEDDNEHRYIVHGKTTDNTTLPVGYLNLLASSYDSELLKAYRDGQFCNLSAASTYYMFTRETRGETNNGNIQEVEYNPNKPIYFGQDWNVSPLSSVLVQIYDTTPKVRVFDELSLHHGGNEILTERLIHTIKEKYPNTELICYPDASGGARHTSAMYSDIELLRRNGITVRVRPSNPSVIARVNAVNKMLEKEIIIDPSCKELIEDLEKVSNKPGGSREIDKTNKDRTHMTDAFGYLIEYEFPVIKPHIGAINRYGGKA